jgi:hypothetical protein
MKPRNADRRRDPRVRVFGHAAVQPGGFLTEVCGSLVDVSAGGARLRFVLAPPLRVGASYPVDLSVADAKAPPGALPVRLRGHAVLLRLDDEAAPLVDGAIRFTEPLRVTEAFRSPVVPVR